VELYFLRHGPAASIEEAGVERDSERPLTDDGLAVCTLVGEGLKRLSVRFDVVASSPLKRARQTADAVAAPLGIKDRVVVTEAMMPGCTITDLADFVRSHRHAAKIVLVGHQPDLSELVAELVGGARMKMPKAGLARVDLDEVAPGAGTLRWLLEPGMMVMLARVPMEE